jgi:hypothetical protein
LLDLLFAQGWLIRRSDREGESQAHHRGYNQSPPSQTGYVHRSTSAELCESTSVNYIGYAPSLTLRNGSGKQALHVMTAGVVPKLESFSTLFGLLFASC